MTRLAPAAAWRARLHAAANAPPMRERVPLAFGSERIGSVEPDLFHRAGLARNGLVRLRGDGWSVEGALTETLARLAHGLRSAGLAHVWRDEQLAVRGASGEVLGTVERAAARPLGIATHAVHLLATDEAGRHWVQHRALDKPTDPGLWDTLVGGMVPARDALEEALARETWEEAGLRLAQLRDLRHGGRTWTHRPFRELAHGYVVECMDWYTCTLPDGIVPANQDGEVAGFACLAPEELVRRLEADQFTMDAAVLLVDACAS